MSSAALELALLTMIPLLNADDDLGFCHRRPATSSIHEAAEALQEADAQAAQGVLPVSV